MKKKILMSLSSVLLLGTLATMSNTKVEAAEWVPNTPDVLKIENGQTSYTMILGDTLWAISQRVNLTVQTLADINGINLNNGEQYFLPVGRVIHFNGNKVTVKDNSGNVVSSTVVTDDQKVNPNQNVGETVDNSVTESQTPDNGSIEKPVKPTQPEENVDGNGENTEPGDGGNTDGGDVGTTDPGDGENTGGGDGGTTDPGDGNEIPDGPYAGTIIPGANNGAVGTWTDKNAMMDYIENNWDAVSGGLNDYSMTTNGFGWIAMFY